MSDDDAIDAGTVVAFADAGHSTAAFAPLTPAQYHTHYANTALPLIIDQGTYEFRAGFANEAAPRVRLRPFVGKSKGTKTQADFYCKVGNQLNDTERIRLRSRTPYDADMLSYYETMEHVLDYSLLALGLDGQSSVDHPIVLTEPVINPNYTRGRLSEIMFEAYGVPAVSYGIDALFAYRYNMALLSPDERVDAGNGLIINAGHNFTHVIPIVDGLPVFTQSARISVGGSTGQSLLEADLINDYPQHRTQITPPRAQEIVEKYCEISEDDYNNELKKMALFDINDCDDDRPCVEPVIIQLPFVQPTVPVLSEAERRAREQRRKENTDRLRQLLAKKREDQIAQLQQNIGEYEGLKLSKLSGSLSVDEFLRLLKKGGFENETDFDNTLATFKRRLHKLLTGEEELPEEKKSDEELYPLLAIPDEELTTDQLKEKRKQKMFKGAAEARVKKREEKALIESQRAALEAAEAKERESDPIAYIAKLHALKSMILDRRSQRNKVESTITGGRRSATSRKRMAIIASQMGNTERLPTANEKDDRFGMNDEDWDVYKQAVLPSKAPANDSDNDSDDERHELSIIEDKLVAYDPNYRKPSTKPVITERDFQLHVYVNRIRVPELIYQPTMIGIDESGLTETIRRILVRMNNESQASKLMRNVLVTGGASLFPHFDARLKRELVSVRPVDSVIHVRHAKDSMLDAWRGAATISYQHYQSLPFTHNHHRNNRGVPAINYVTRRHYDECGADYLAEHACSNPYVPTPALDEEDLKAAKKRKR